MYSEDKASGSIAMDTSLNDIMAKAKPRRNQVKTPYARPAPPMLPYHRADPNAKAWGHDLFGQQVKGGNLAHRIAAAGASTPLDLGGKDLLDDGVDLRRNGAPKAAPKPGSLASRVSGLVSEVAGRGAAAPARGGRASPSTAPAAAAAGANGGGPGLSIKGKSANNVVEVSNLAAGTTADDVKMTFESFGPITSAKLSSRPSPPGSVAVILEFSTPSAAQASITAYHGLIADGRTISVQFKPLSSPPASSKPAAVRPAAAPRVASAPGLLGRLGMPAVVRAAGGGGSKTSAKAPVQVQEDLMSGLGGSGMYSDAIQDPRASIQVVPGASSSARANGGRGRGGGRGGRRQGGGGGAVRGVGGMDVD